MTVLARFAREGRDELVSMQCDLCVPPVLSASTTVEMQKLGWLLADDGHDLDVCPGCALSVPERSRRRRGDATPVTPDPERLPNLVVIGAAKAGSTSLHNYLDLHPEISMSHDKEVRYFTDPDCLSWVGRYQSYFPAGTRYRGESTPQYTKFPLYPGVVDRMADLTPDARLVYLVRDPVERAIAEYVEEVTWGVIGASIDEELRDADAVHNVLVAPSRYATQLREFHRRFDPSQILVVDLAELAEHPAVVVARVFDFLGLERIDLDDEALRPRNAYGDKGALPGWYRVFRRPALVRLAHKLPKEQLTRMQYFFTARLTKPVERPQPTEETLARLRAVLAPEAAELREMTGQAFAGWSV
ncbi:sulfotransferase family protein [Nocardioides antri]|uniref:Sulfotransferase n=1 Tax=Nocardioides antri TaxID=2607659 RepID=A0A5B1M3Z0_9ACTN|nr:sulfotransferase [Nocardioides antri]KAA1427494.1 sulfotransferase [Nocardioides antri]